MTALTRKELAASAGISTRTLQRWLEPHRNTLRALGMMPNKKKEGRIKPATLSN